MVSRRVASPLVDDSILSCLFRTSVHFAPATLAHVAPQVAVARNPHGRIPRLLLSATAGGRLRLVPISELEKWRDSHAARVLEEAP
jgi:hypothetical protein